MRAPAAERARQARDSARACDLTAAADRTDTMARVLFVYPNLYTQMGFNHGLASLSATLKRAGHETKLLNLNENLPPVPTSDDVVAEVRAWRPTLIGFSCLTMQYDGAVELARLLRDAAARQGFELPPLVVGGIHPTMVPEKVMADGVWDHVGVGECEDALLELVGRVAAGEAPDDVQNFLSWKAGVRPADAEQCGLEDLRPHWVRNEVGEFPRFGELPFPDYELFDTARITEQKDGWFGLMTSRGCPYRCTYCLNHKVVDLYKRDLGRGVSQLNFFRYRSPEQMIEEIRFVLERYPVKTFILDDDLFTMNPEHAIAFCEAYAAADIGVPFVVNSHVKRLDPRLAAALAKAGCRILKLGIESGSPRVRSEVLQRFMSQDDILATVASAEEFELHTSGFVMVGLPSETPAERLETVDILAKARIGRFRTSFFYPFPGTQGYELAVENGHVDRSFKSQLADFTDGSVMDFGPVENLEIDKLGRLMPWFVNARMAFYHEAPAARLYQPWVERVTAMDQDEWRAFRSRIPALDRRLSEAASAAGHLHYAIRYNAWMGVRSDFFHAEESGLEWTTAAARPRTARLEDLADEAGHAAAAFSGLTEAC